MKSSFLVIYLPCKATYSCVTTEKLMILLGRYHITPTSLRMDKQYIIYYHT